MVITPITHEIKIVLCPGPSQVIFSTLVLSFICIRIMSLVS